MSGIGITVGVATYERPEGLERCLRAIASQSVPPSEVIVVDQAASDETRAVVAASGLPGVRHVERPPLGLSASRNVALALATEPVLAVTDDDCVPDDGWLAAVTGAFDGSPRPGAVTGRVLPLGEPTHGTYAVSSRESIVPVDYNGRVMPWDAGSGGNFAALTDTLRSVGGWDERLGVGSGGLAGEDADLLHRLLSSGSTVRYEPDAIVHHERQSRARRVATRWSYGYGIGAMCGLWLAHGDRYALRVVYMYLRLRVGPFLRALRRRDRSESSEYARALASVFPGLLYGLRASRLPASSIPAR